VTTNHERGGINKRRGGFNNSLEIMNNTSMTSNNIINNISIFNDSIVVATLARSP
jgi:hypothetical protein